MVILNAQVQCKEFDNIYEKYEEQEVRKLLILLSGPNTILTKYPQTLGVVKS